MSTRQVQLVVTVAGIARCGIEYGLQDKSGHLLDGNRGSDGEESWQFAATVRQKADGSGPPGGPYVHGKPGGRFLYISFRGADGDWMRRTKVPLPDRLDASVERLHARVRDVGTPWVQFDHEWAEESTT